jgi:hypothetical protein
MSGRGGATPTLKDHLCTEELKEGTFFIAPTFLSLPQFHFREGD